MKRLLVPLFLCLGACSHSPTRPLTPVIDGRSAQPLPNVSPEINPAPSASPLGSAVVALLDQAEDYHRAGAIDNEAATIERALRIAPKNAHLWSRLAAVRLAQDRPEQAEQLALKSNALAPEDSLLQARNWHLVAQARWSVNDSSGARAAEQKARKWGGN